MDVIEIMTLELGDSAAIAAEVSASRYSHPVPYLDATRGAGARETAETKRSGVSL